MRTTFRLVLTLALGVISSACSSTGSAPAPVVAPATSDTSGGAESTEPPVSPVSPDAISYRGHTVDLSGCPSERRAEIATWIRAQIDLVEAVRVRPDVSDWLRSVPVRIDTSLRAAGHYSVARGLELNGTITRADNPVLLHELLHGYHARMSPEGRAQVEAYYQSARTLGRWPADAYMLSNTGEFFAMTVSVALHGRAARPPSTRDELRAAMPEYFAWIVGEFGLVVE